MATVQVERTDLGRALTSSFAMSDGVVSVPVEDDAECTAGFSGLSEELWAVLGWPAANESCGEVFDLKDARM